MMNYTQVLEKTEQLKTGKKVPYIGSLLDKFSFKNVIYIPEGFEYDMIGEYMEAVLKEHKFLVGRFTSYAIKRPLGHILYNGKAISRKDFAKYGEEFWESVGGSIGDMTLTGMEAYLRIALEYFADKNVDFLILPSEKKCDLEMITEALDEASINTREQVAKELVVSMLKGNGVDLKEKLLLKAFDKCKNEGKFELLKKKPYFIADGADSGSSVKLLMAKLQYSFPDNSYIFIVGTLQDGYEEVVRESALTSEQLITVTPPEHTEALPGIELAQEYKKLNPNITNTSGLEEAIEIATILAEKSTVIVAFGTTAILERYRDIIQNGTCRSTK